MEHFLEHLGADHLDDAPAGGFGLDWFVGSWDLEWSRPGDSSAPSSLPGQLHVAPVLGGRAVQDVWMVPDDRELTPELRPFAFHGTTVRFFDSALGAWRSTWIEPVNGRVRTFIGRPQDDQLHLISADGTPWLRWRFTDVTADRFVWLGEFSDDEGRHWELEERMVVSRRIT